MVQKHTHAYACKKQLSNHTIVPGSQKSCLHVSQSGLRKLLTKALKLSLYLIVPEPTNSASIHLNMTHIKRPSPSPLICSAEQRSYVKLTSKRRASIRDRTCFKGHSFCYRKASEGNNTMLASFPGGFLSEIPSKSLLEHHMA